MNLSSALCHTQEAHHHALARAAVLDNVRLVATSAAAAWAKEGESAKRREARQLRAHVVAEAQVAMVEPPSVDARALSENPDRGYASIGHIA